MGTPARFCEIMYPLILLILAAQMPRNPYLGLFTAIKKAVIYPQLREKTAHKKINQGAQRDGTLLAEPMIDADSQPDK